MFTRPLIGDGMLFDEALKLLLEGDAHELPTRESMKRVVKFVLSAYANRMHVEVGNIAANANTMDFKDDIVMREKFRAALRQAQFRTEAWAKGEAHRISES